MTEPAINASLLDIAALRVRRTLDSASRGDLAAQRALLRYAEADNLETHLIRLAALADRCAPSLDEIKINKGQFSYDAQQLRFEIDRVGDVLNRAAGRATVVALDDVRAAADESAAPPVSGDAA